MGIGGYSHVISTKGGRTQVGGLTEDRMLGRQHHLMAAGQSLYHHLENIGCYFFILMSFSYRQNRHLCYCFQSKSKEAHCLDHLLTCWYEQEWTM